MAYDPKKFDWWKAKLKGEDVPIHADQAMQGYYAYKANKTKAPLPVALWYDAAGELMCHLDGKPFRNGLDLWLGCSRNPITHAIYKSVIAGEGWPEEIRITVADGSVESSMAKGIGHNSGDSSKDFISLTGNIAEWIDQAKKAVKVGAPKTKADADAIADLATKLLDLSNEADEKRLAETKPLREEKEAIDTRWNAFILEGKKLVKDLKTLGHVYIVEEGKRRAAAALAAQEAARAEMTKNSPPNEDGQPDESIAQVRVEAEPVRIGTRKTVSAVTEKTLFVDDRAAMFAFFATMDPPPQDIMDVMEKRAKMIIKGGLTVPGVRMVSSTGAR